MSIFSKLFGRDKVTNNLSSTVSTSRPFSFGKSASGVRVNERTALATAGVYACVRVLSEAVASLPLHVYEKSGNGSVIADEHPLYDILHSVPNNEMTSFIFRETLMSHILIYGNGYAQIIRDVGGRIKALYPLMSDKMKVSRNDSGAVCYTYYPDFPRNNNSGVVLRREDVLHIPSLSFDGLIGHSPIAMEKNAIGMSISAENYGATFFANGAVPSGVLEFESSTKEPEKVRDKFKNLYGGKGLHSVAVLEDGLKFKPVSVPPDEAQFLETRKFQLSEICRIFRVPPHMVGDLERSTFSNIEHQSISFVMYTLDPWICRLEQSMEMQLLTSQERKKYAVKFNLDGLLRGDYETRMRGYAVGRQNGWMSANDIRKLERLTPLPAEKGGDKYLVNGNMTDLEKFMNNTEENK